MKIAVLHINMIGFLIILIGLLLADYAPNNLPLFGWFDNQRIEVKNPLVRTSKGTPSVTPTPTISVVKPPTTYVIPSSGHVAQTFNNCGPATLSMVMSYFGKQVSQDVLREEMRPFNNPQGGVDDKSIFANEFVTHAQKNGFEALHRPNGDINLLKKLIANDIPVVLRTWLHPDEDMGHFRVVRGYDDSRNVLIQDDSYEGKDLEYSYDTFLSMWQPFNYGYIVVYPKEKAPVVEALLGKEIDEKVAYQNSIQRADREIESGSTLARFNKSTAYYHLGEYAKSIQEYENVRDQLGYRTLWYQVEPFEAYLEVGQYDTVIDLATTVINSGNTAFSELYYFRGKAYLAKDLRDQAKLEFESAVYYNKNYQVARDALTNM